MINMNSPVVQNMMQSSGFNPYMNNGYIPQQNQNIYQNYSGYNPYVVNQQQEQQEYYNYDPIPQVVVNENRGINSSIQQQNYGFQQPMNYGFNNYAFNGYVNPFLMKNQMEANRLRQREEAIQQGKIWRALLKGQACNDEDFNLDDTIQMIEGIYYQEPVYNDLPIKEKIIVDRNNHIAELECRLNYLRQNNIPIMDSLYGMRMNFYKYYEHLNSIMGNPEECDIVKYFSEVYPQLMTDRLSWESERYNRNLKNKYNSKDFNKLIDKEAANRPDSYYYKLMETFADNGVKFTNNDGLTITADEMEIKLPDRLLQSRKDRYYEQRKRFYDSVFKKV